MSSEQAAGTRLSVPAEIESPRGKLVYLYLSSRGAATVGELGAQLDITKLTLLTVLRSLCDRGFVVERDERYAPA
jgi:DNA-binding MarR family transcriptional regulator